MGVWEKLSPEKKAEYRHRMENVKNNSDLPQKEKLFPKT